MSQHQTHHSAPEPKRLRAPRRREQGYALLSLLAGMTIAVVIMAAAAPSLKQESQREREEEMFWRGSQVAHAIARYQLTHGQQLPTKLEDLAELSETAGRRERLLRPSALRDPMTAKGEWKLIRVGDPMIAELYSAYLLAKKIPPPPNSMLARYGGLQSGAVVGGGLQNTGPSLLSQVMKSNSFDSEFGPIVGVVSQSKEPLIRNYYGLTSALMIDGVGMPGVLVTYPVGGGGGGNAKAPIGDQGCKGADGGPCKGVCIGGKCTGVLVPGKCPPEMRGKLPDCPDAPPPGK